MFVPSQKILENYAKVMVDFALGKGKGIKEKEVVYLQYDTEALPLALTVFKRILEKGGYPMVRGIEERFQKAMFDVATDDQLKFFPKKYTKTLVDTIDHRIYLIAPTNPFLLKNVDPKRIVTANSEKQMLRRWLFEKEDKGKLTWTLCLYGTAGTAKEAGLTLKEFWQEIFNACYLAEVDPIKKWQEVFTEINKIKTKLNSLSIDKLHLTAKDTDLWIKIGEKRRWRGGDGCNIPSFEIFTSPDWRGTNGHIYFDFPLYRYGNLIKGIYLEFKEGKVVKTNAKENEALLKAIVSQKNADKIGEFSLTDKRFSKISRFMANTLYDENFGGKWGNTHLALGSSYHDCYTGAVKKMTKKDWEKLGFNESAEHVDIIMTGNRKVEAILKDRTKKLIYKDGIFIL